MDLKIAQDAIAERLAKLKDEERERSKSTTDSLRSYSYPDRRRILGLTACGREEFYVCRPEMKKRLLCRTCSHELDILSNLLRNNHIETIPEIYMPKLLLEGTDLVLWNVYVVESDLKEAARLISDHGLAVWVHKD
jgi:hypothetical protein